MLLNSKLAFVFVTLALFQNVIGSGKSSIAWNKLYKLFRFFFLDWSWSVTRLDLIWPSWIYFLDISHNKEEEKIEIKWINPWSPSFGLGTSIVSVSGSNGLYRYGGNPVYSNGVSAYTFLNGSPTYLSPTIPGYNTFFNQLPIVNPLGSYNYINTFGGYACYSLNGQYYAKYNGDFWLLNNFDPYRGSAYNFSFLSAF